MSTAAGDYSGANASLLVTTMRLGMLARGYHPVPVLRHDANDKAAGKRPTLAKWETVCSTADEKTIRQWTADRQQKVCTNTGILCGDVIGLDIDVPDEHVARQIGALADAMLPPTPLHRIGKAPKSLRAYRADGVHRKISTPALTLPNGTKVQVEALGAGNQFVSFGTHPETKQPYVWPNRSPLDVALADLPILPADTLRGFLAAAEAVMRAAGGKTEAEIKDGSEAPSNPAPRKPKDQSSTFPPTTRQDVADALGAVPNRHDWAGWVRIGGAIYDALADDGEDLFLEWSAQSSKYDAKATKAKWKSFRRSPMTVSENTLFYEARKNGWRPASEIERDQRQDGAEPTGEWTGQDEPPPDIDDPGYMEAVAEAVNLDPIDALMAEFNLKYMVVNEAGKAVLYAPAYDPVLKRRYHNRMEFSDLMKLHLNRTVRNGVDKKGEPVFNQVAMVWLRHRDRRQYIDGVTFDPSGNHDNPQVLNLWQGFAVKPKPGTWKRMRRHIYEVLCCSNQELFDYVLNWMARLVQFPAQQGEVAIVLKGIEGAGKGIVARALLYILGQHGLAISHAKHLTGNFNSHLRDAVFLFADEAFYAGDKAHVGVLKALITEPTLTVEAKYQNAVQAPNFLHIMMASNEEWVVPAGLEARRFLVLLVAATYAQNWAYFSAIQQEMATGGYEAMLHDLLSVDLSGFDVTDVPHTEGLQEQKKLSLGTSESWWLDCLHRGYVYKSKLGLEQHFGEWHEVDTTEILYASYSEFAKVRNERHTMAREAFGRFMVSMGGKANKPRNAVVGEHITDVLINQHGDTTRKAALIRKERSTGYSIGDLKAARAAFTDTTKLPVEWESDDEEPS